jgi:hypothetical protein
VGAPQEVGGDFNCSYNQLKSLVGAPQEVGRHFDCEHNQLVSLEGASKIVLDFKCGNNPVSQKALVIILNKMLKGVSYTIALATSKKEIAKRDWNRLDKTGLTPDLEKGASTLGRFGVFDS